VISNSKLWYKSKRRKLRNFCTEI